MAKEITKKMILEAIIRLVDMDPDGVVMVGENEDIAVHGAEIQEYAALTIKQIDAKNEKAKERAKQKRAEGDELLAVVKDALTDEYKSGAEILADIVASGFTDVTQAKVTARLTKLCNAGEAVKTDIKVDKRKIKGYALATEAATEDVKTSEV
jgi:hypothetical protein